jgi:membrane dipeptidase
MATLIDEEQAASLHREAVVIDGMNNAGLTPDYFAQMIAGGVTAAMVPVSISDTFVVAVEKILALRKMVESSDTALIVEEQRDIALAKSTGRVGLILALEDARQYDKDLRKVDLFRRLGVRRSQLVYTTLNEVGCGAGDRIDSGLSKYGVDLIGELERCRILIDLSHAGQQTLEDALQVVTRPCVWSHCNVQGIFGHKNNLTDDQLTAVAENDGVVGVSGVPFYTGGAEVTLSEMIDHVDYIIERIGVDHVGIGLAIFENHPQSFYDQFASLPVDVYGTAPWEWPTGISTVSEFPNLTAELIRRGYPNEDILKIIGGNMLRVCTNAWLI